MSNDLFAAGVRLRDLGLRVYPVGAGKEAHRPVEVLRHRGPGR